ncbi:hypothetical protein BC940DRAFT_314453 [Gongronella butleri]|nr:hypothetical protein BC940DRAFT_314453 [Gongronella butleri]
MSLSKPCWDKVQILQNDVLLWQPRFVTRLAAAQSSLSSSSSGSSPPPHFHPRRTSHDSLGSDLFATASDRFSTPLLSSSSFMSQSHERIGALYDHAAAPPPPPTLLAVVVVMAEGIWDLHTMTAEKRATYRLQFTDFRYFNAIKHMGNDENVTTLDIEDLTLDDFSDAQRPERLVARTLAKPLMPKKNTAMVSLFSRLIMSPALSKQTKLTSIVVCNACWKFSADISFIDQLVSFQSMPQDMVFIDPPTQYITVYAHILDTSVDYKPRHSPSRATVVVDNLQIATDIVVGQPLVDVRTYIQNVDVFLVDDVMDLDELSVVQAGSGRPLEARQYWTLIGMKSVVMSRNLEAQVKIKLNEMLAAPNVDIAVLNDILTVEGCSDSFQSLVNLVTYVANDGDDLFPHTAVPHAAKAARAAKRHSHTTLQKHREDMLASLDEHAFNQRQVSTSISASSSTGKTKSQLSTLANGPLSTASPELNLIEGFYSSSSSSSTPSQEKRKQNQPLPVTGTQTSTSSSLRPRKPLRKQPHPRLHRPATAAEDIVRVLASDVHELDIVENFFGMDKKKEARKPVVDTRRAKLSVRVRDVDILWKMYAGHDWHYVQQQQQQHSPPISSSSPQGASPPMSTSSRASSRHTTHPTTHPTTASPSYGSPSTISSLDSRRAHTIGPPRGEPEMELRVEGITLALDIMPANDQTALHTHLTIRDIELADNLKTSNWDVFFGYMRADEPTSNMPRERDADMLVLDVLGVRPVKHDDTIEYRVKLKTLPLRFYIDQDALNFLVQFFAFNPAVLHSTPAEAIQAPDDDHVENDLFFQQVEIYPIRLKIDYKPKYVNYDNIKEGQFAELVNLFRLEGAKLDLSAVKLTGIRGVGKLVERLGQEWLPHIKQTQVPHMVSGVTPIRSMVNLGSGIADLVLIPLQQYRRDGRVIKGLQKGTQSFARSTAMEIIKLSALLASGTNVIWEHALNSTSASSSSSSAQGNNNFIRNSQDTRRNHNDLQQPSASGMPSSSLSPTSTVIASRTSDDMVFVFTDRHLDLDP